MRHAGNDSPTLPSDAGSHRRRATLPGIALALTLLLPAPTPALAGDAISVEVVGEGGRPLVLIPGLSNGGDVWDATVAALEEDFELHVVTLAGFAGTAPVETDGPFLDAVRLAVIDHLREHRLEDPVIVGHSLGGFLAFWIAATAPESVAGVVAVDGVPFLPALQNEAATEESQQQTAASIEAMFASMTPEQFRLQNGMALQSMLTDGDERERIAATSALSDPATVGRAVAELMVTDLRDDLASIRVPILQFAAVGQSYPEEMRRHLEERYRGQLEAAEDVHVVAAPSSHFVMIDARELFLSELRAFIGDLP